MNKNMFSKNNNYRATFQNNKEVQKVVCKNNKCKTIKKNKNIYFYNNKYKIISAKQQEQQFPKIFAQNNKTNCKIFFAKQ